MPSSFYFPSVLLNYSNLRITYCMKVLDIFSRPAQMAKVALPLVRHGELNPEEKTCSVLVYWRLVCT